jgi:Protein of unknown function (DUF2917)
VARCHRESLRLTDGVGLEVRCLLGNLWITEEGNHEDKIIGNGESFVLDRHGLSLVTALGGPALLVVRRAPSLLHIHCGMRRKRHGGCRRRENLQRKPKSRFSGPAAGRLCRFVRKLPLRRAPLSDASERGLGDLGQDFRS